MPPRWFYPRQSLVLTLLFMFVLLPGLAPARAAAVAASIAVDQTVLDISVPLGQTFTATLAVTNTSEALIPLTTYEARSPTALQLRRGRGPAQAPLPTDPARIERGLAAALQAAPAAPQEVLIYLRDRADLSAAYQIANWNERGEYVYRTLTEHANRSQRDIAQQLMARGLSYRSLWVVNALLVRGSSADVQAIAARSDVAQVRLNHTLALAAAPRAASAEQCSPGAPENPVCWNVRAIRADSVWRDFGVNGRGVVLANIDTGVAFDHPALTGSYRGRATDGTVDHAYSWFDPQGEYQLPTDSSIHGSHTMGIMVGAAVGDGPAVGVAPGARWIAAQGCEGLFCNDADLIASAQWMLAPTRPDGSAPRPDLRPMIINNSWAANAHDDWYAPYTAAWRAAGIFPVFAGGNASALFPQECGSAPSPGDYSDVVGVGATTRQGEIAGFSLLGPTKDGRLKPDFVAPGASIYSTVPPGKGGYQTLNGTSMAAPHVAATIALLWSANPALIGDYDATYALLRDTATRRDDPRCNDALGAPNNIYGLGQIDAYAAVAKARIDLPWLTIENPNADLPRYGVQTLRLRFDAARVTGPGTYTGNILLYGGDLSAPLQSVPVTLRVLPAAAQVTVRGVVRDDQTGAALYAQVVLGRNGLAGEPIATSADGTFAMTLARGSQYDLIGSAVSYRTLRQPITATSDMTVELRLQQDLPRLTLPRATVAVTLPIGGVDQELIPIENTGTRPLFYQLDVPPDGFTISRSDASAGPSYNWIDLPASAAVLPAGSAILTDHVPLGFRFPFYTYTITDVVITSEGMLAVDRPLAYRGLASNCLPDEWFSFYMIAPLRLAIDTSKGGQIRYGAIDEQRFVVSYEDVQLKTGLPGQTYSFQVILAADGRITFQYKQLGRLPDRASVGIQRAPGAVQQLGCGAATPVSNQLAIELRPQPNPAFWLATDVTSGTLQPGERALVPITIRWQRPVPDTNTLVGRVHLSTNDLYALSADIPVRVALRPASYELWLPLGGR